MCQCNYAIQCVLLHVVVGAHADLPSLTSCGTAGRARNVPSEAGRYVVVRLSTEPRNERLDMAFHTLRSDTTADR